MGAFDIESGNGVGCNLRPGHPQRRPGLCRAELSAQAPDAGRNRTPPPYGPPSGRKNGDGEIVDVETASASIVYSYSVAGVTYESSQDVRALQALLPPDVMTMVGPVSVKFDPRNPANSIVLCEEWSGLRSRAG